MLVLSRRSGDRVILTVRPADMQKLIGANALLEITVEVVDIDRNKVRLGFACPRFVEIYREESLVPPGQTSRHSLEEGANYGKPEGQTQEGPAAQA